eukprot:TRINITY_DN6058_c0_g1_i1.p1 TRINITY_DN6058_c0_g1~~TRINITY_DN6058_c0_g1_i1.p1  ORF type:complete len:165 (+),score=30.09 TRINITY_DN6058_c0_g1_i1:132-626(+)
MRATTLLVRPMLLKRVAGNPFSLPQQIQSIQSGFSSVPTPIFQTRVTARTFATSKHPDITEFDESKNFSKLTSAEGLHLVDFYANWCGPCLQLGPRLEKLVETSEGKVKLIKVNVDKNPEIATTHSITSIPAVYAYKNGKNVGNFIGALPDKKITEFVENMKNL